MSKAAKCCICGGSEYITVERQKLRLVGIGTEEICYGICVSCGHIQQFLQASGGAIKATYEQMSNYKCFDTASAKTAQPSPLLQQLTLTNG